jgi:hypothetical protein
MTETDLSRNAEFQREKFGVMGKICSRGEFIVKPQEFGLPTEPKLAVSSRLTPDTP